MPPRSVTRVDIDRRETARHAAIDETRKRVDGIKLVALARNQRAAEERVEKVLAADGDRERFVRLARKDWPLASRRFPHGRVVHVLRRTLREETVRHAKLNLVRIGNRI